jgi:D-glycero-beta-D-manno-heptose-7-phosphate kinase
MNQFRSATSLFEAFKDLKVLVIGDMMVDSYVWGNVSRMSPEAPVPVVLIEKREKRLGGAANVALNIQALGATPIPCAVIGDDDAGQFFLNRLEERGISSEGIVTSTERPTTIKERVLSDDKQVLRVDSETDKVLSAEEQSQLLEKTKKLLPSCQVVIFQDYDKGVINAEIIQALVSEAKRLGIPTVVDPKRRNFLSYKNVSLFKPNLKELKEGLDIEVDPTDLDSLNEGVLKLTSKLDCDQVMVTLSEHGVFIKNEAESFKIPAHPRQINDVSGAGDTVISIAALVLALGLDSKQIAATSNLGGGLVCEHVGVVPINKEDLITEIDSCNFL